MAGVFLTNWHCRCRSACVAAHRHRRARGLVTGTLIAKMKIPPFIATLGMMLTAKGLALVISGPKPIYFNDTPSLHRLAMGSLLGADHPGFADPQRGADPVRRGDRRQL